ncbi:MAG: undecaprenyl-phosphate galactose phosphotransferase WbaP [Candidatus Kapaibacterium sp.]|nr:undecaprenyl-phosphate galactose phosphotransferase WbaP [Ignavibacteriota bacterium]MCB9220557.1 undecaprenyl-phosphate galactose phosphotransferase WbaP [Ignavibacteria bacterium]
MQTPTLNELSELLKSNQENGYSIKKVAYRKLIASTILMISDSLMIIISVLASVFIRNLFFTPAASFDLYIKILPVIVPLFLLAFYMRGLYPGFGVDAIEEVRNIFYTNSIIFGLMAGFTFFINDFWDFSRLSFLLSWLITFAMIPLGRSLIRKLFCEKSWWGIPVIIIGAGNAGKEIINSLRKHKRLGLRPIVAIDDNVDTWGYIDNIPVIGGLEVIPELQKKLKIEQSIVAMPNVQSDLQKKIILRYSKYFDKTIVIPYLFGISTIWVSSREFGGILGLEVKQKLLKKTAQLQKRIFDIVIASILSLLSIPILAVIAIHILLDSKGKVLFKQTRMGINDTRFKIIKFRTMHTDAEERLTELLEKNPKLKAEYEIYHKMNDDPRLTKIGKFLRKYSFDELPQFWNVIRGEMSLIGPRAYIPWEKIKMNGNDEMILQVKPGISGLWQVTDRNNSSFEERIMIDIYYIRNWSMFLDLYILAKTVKVVITGKGG